MAVPTQEVPEHVDSDVAAALADMERRLTALQRESVSDLSALLNLYALLPPRGMLPPQTDFTASPVTIAALVQEVLSPKRSMTVLECGSGSSTVWLAAACRIRGRGTVVALEHDQVYAAQTTAALVAHELADVAEVRYAPLTPLEPGSDVRWYAKEAYRDVRGIDLLFVDGPPGSSGPLARQPAVPQLADRLQHRALIVLDDADRPDEREVLSSWRAADLGSGAVTEPLRVGRSAQLQWRRRVAR